MVTLDFALRKFTLLTTYIFCLADKVPLVSGKPDLARPLDGQADPGLGYVERNCFEVIGDSYTQGLLDVEAKAECLVVVGDMLKKEDTVLRRL